MTKTSLLRMAAKRFLSALDVVFAVVLISIVSLGCPLERAKKVGFFDRAQAKDIRQRQKGEPCSEGKRPATAEECEWARKKLDITDCEDYCLPIR